MESLMTSLWQIEAYKYDGQLHYRMPAYLRSDDGECLHFRAQLGGFLDHRTRGWRRITLRPSDMFFWRDRWYNVFRNYAADGRLRHYYCNIGLPPHIQDGVISFVDLDLDVEIQPDGRIEILDEDEFIAHAVHYAYPPDIQQTARQTVETVLALWQSRAAPFDLAVSG
jgi:protein associated with RNAse G/E